MKLLRSLLLSVVTAMALLGTQGGPSVAEAGSHGYTRVYWVYYRACPHYNWQCYGGFYSANQAAQAINWFRAAGYETFYR